LNGDRFIPFTFSKIKNKSIWNIAFDSTFAYAGTSNDGMILRSKDRYLWENFYQLDDNLVTALIVDGNFLFAGTSPKGKLYRINLTTSTVTLDNTLDGEVVGFVSYNGDLYAATSKPSFVYKFNIVNNKWESFYKPYGTSLNQISSFDGKIWVAIDGENMVSYDGSEWKIEISNPDNIATTRKVSKNIFSYTTYDFIDTKDLTKTDGLTNEEILDIFPYNRMVGIGSFSEDGSTVTVGGKNYGRVYQQIIIILKGMIKKIILQQLLRDPNIQPIIKMIGKQNVRIEK